MADAESPVSALERSHQVQLPAIAVMECILPVDQLFPVAQLQAISAMVYMQAALQHFLAAQRLIIPVMG